VTSRILIRKLGFLAKLLKGEEKLSAQVLRTLACEDIYNISLIQQCRTLEHLIGTNHLLSFLQDFATITLSDIKKYILDKDWKRTLHLASSHSSLAIVTVSSSVASSWNSFWDEALDFDYGVRGTRLMQSLFSTLSRPLFGNRLCPHCNGEIRNDLSFHQHLFSIHLTTFNSQDIAHWLEEKNFPELFKLAEDISSLKFNTIT